MALRRTLKIQPLPFKMVNFLSTTSKPKKVIATVKFESDIIHQPAVRQVINSLSVCVCGFIKSVTVQKNESDTIFAIV